MASYLEDLKKLKGPQRDASAALISLFASYGLESLAGRIIDMVKQGFSADTMTVMLQKTPEYETRFAANKKRVANGMAALSPKEYIEAERSYRAVMKSSGMPGGFYDSRTDYQKFLENDLSPAELNERVGAWQDVAKSDSNTLGELRRLYGMDAAHYAAYLMDPTRATPLLKKQAQAVQFAGAASRHGFSINRSMADLYGQNLGVTSEAAEKGWAAVQEVQDPTEKIGNIYGDSYSVEDAASEVFGGNADAAAKRKKIASKERATFSGSSRGATGQSRNSSY